MKKYVCPFLGVVLALSVSLATAEVPGVVYVGSIDISSVSNFPGCIDFYNGALFVGSFNNQDVLKITDPTGPSPVVTQFIDLSSRTTWASGRGVQGVQIDQATGKIYVAGDNGSDGYLAVLDQAGAFVDEETVIGQRLVTVAPYAYGSAEVVASYVINSSLRTYTLNGASPLTQVSVSGVFTTPYNGNVRDLVVDGNKIYYARNGSTVDACAVIDNSATPGDLSSLLPTGIYQAADIHGVAVQGIGLLKWKGATYILFADIGNSTTPRAPAVQFIDVANPLTSALSVTDPSMTGGIRDACVAEISGKTYMFVTEPGATPPTGDKIQIFRLYDTAGVEDWMMF